MKITLEQIRSWEPCYSEERLLELAAGRTEFTPQEIAELEIPAGDRVWVLLRHEVLGDQLQPLLERWAEWAIRRMLGKSCVPVWETWAERWLSGEDRSARAASAAFAAAYAAAAYAARAADSAARAAAAAYWAAWAAANAADSAADSADYWAAWAATCAAAYAADSADYWAGREHQLREIMEVLR